MIDPEHFPPILTKKQRIALFFSQLFIGLFIIFMAGAILHHYLPMPGTYGVHYEGIFLGVIVVLHVKRVLEVYEETGRTEDE